MNWNEYRAIEGTNWSKLKSLRVSPLQYDHDQRTEQPDAVHFRIGRAAHAFLLERDGFEKRFVCFKGTRRGKAWDEFKVMNDGREILTEPEWMRALGAAAAIDCHPIAGEILSAGLSEVVITWTDAETGIKCKGRADHVNGRLVDIKSTSSLSPRLFATAMARLGYASQLAFYMDGLAANGLVVEPEPILIAVQSEPPHDVIVYRVIEPAVDKGRREYRELLRLLKQCRERDEWPGMEPDRIVDIDLPAWVYMGDEQDSFVIGGEEVTL